MPRPDLSLLEKGLREQMITSAALPMVIGNKEIKEDLRIKVLGHRGFIRSAVADLTSYPELEAPHLPYRSFAVANADTANPLLEFVAPSKTLTVTPNVTFVFTGQGAQWPTIGVKLCSEFPSAVDNFKRMDKVLAELETAPSWTIFDELGKPDAGSMQQDYVQLS
ncbi:Reducing polyketide synthase [Lachnellula occidentalis]|uniref:Reducing polyketide synthase n=1 Tax=Lachnellula occidentalis TaxID=215460 RepID=A0A8H8RJ52_9HELO|nr:Reducing polyketide synthase [Lachnellula occidentalis]